MGAGAGMGAGVDMGRINPFRRRYTVFSAGI